MTQKIDFKKTLDSYQARAGEFRVIDVPELQYLMIDGSGDPNTSQEYVAALEALYPVAYKLKFSSKRDLGRDYVVPPLEGLWWAEDMTAFTSARDKSQWSWTMMILAPTGSTGPRSRLPSRRYRERRSRRGGSATCASNLSPRAAACRRCTAVHMMTRLRRWRTCMTTSFPPTGCE